MVFQSTCVIELCNGSNETSNGISSGTGVVIDSKHGYVISHSSLLSGISSIKSFVKKNKKVENISDEMQCRIFLENCLHIAEENIDDKRGNDKSNICISNSPTNAKNKSSIKSARLVKLWKDEVFMQLVSQLMPKDEGWTFYDTVENASSSKKMVESDWDFYFSLPYFMLFKLDNWIPYDSTTILFPSDNLQQCQIVNVEGTPFGNTSPAVFMNCVSQGIICNTFGKHNEMIITDARCLPGMEGSPLYVIDQNQRMLVGMIAACLCWKNGEWLGMSIACSMTRILDSLQTELWSDIHLSEGISFFHPAANVNQVQSKVALVDCGDTWGTGFMFDERKGLLLTCGHVVQFRPNGKVRIRFGNSNTWSVCNVIFSSKHGQIFDIAILSLEKWTPKYSEELKVSRAQKGQQVYAIGYGCFGPEKSLTSTVTAGNVANVSKHNQIPVIIQSTCIVHAGASGGLLLTTDNTAVGMLVCNAKDFDTGASYPHVNMSIPLTTIWPILRKFSHSGDLKLMQQLTNQNVAVRDLWNLKSVDYLPSKL